MPTVAELQIVIEAQDRASAELRVLGGDLRRVEQRAESAGGAFGRLRGAVSGLGQLGLAAGGLGAIVDGFRSVAGALGGVVRQASDLNEQTSRAGVVFGDYANVVTDFAKTTAASLGITRTEALQAAGSFGTMLRTAGLGAEDVARLSTNLVTLAADLASFNNIEPTEALEKLRSGLAGEAEPLRTLGVLLSEDAVKAEALALGFGQGTVDATKARAATAALTAAQVRYNAVARDATKTAAERETAGAAVQTAEAALNKVMEGSTVTLTEAQKVQARYSLIMKQTATAQGDFARTSTGLANAQRILRASWTDVTTTLGEAFLPTVARAASFLAQQMPAALAATQRAVEAVGPVLAALFSGDLQGALDQAVALVGAAAAALAPVLAQWTQAFLDWVAEMTPQLLEALQTKLGDVWQWIRETAPPLLEQAVGTWIPAFVTWVAQSVPPLYKELDQYMARFSDWIRDVGVPQVLGFGRRLGDALIRGLRQAMGIQPGSDPVAALLRGALGIQAGSDPVADVLGARVENPARPLLSPEAAVAAGRYGGGPVINLGDIRLDWTFDPVGAARQVGDAVAARVLAALTEAAARTDPGANPYLQAAGRAS